MGTINLHYMHNAVRSRLSSTRLAIHMELRDRASRKKPSAGVAQSVRPNTTKHAKLQCTKPKTLTPLGRILTFALLKKTRNFMLK